jgi:uncharacterized protein (DUF433 family)
MNKPRVNGGAALNGVRRSGDHTLIDGTKVRTSDVIEHFMQGANVGVIAKQYRDQGIALSSTQIEDAIRFECCRTCKCDDCKWARSL